MGRALSAKCFKLCSDQRLRIGAKVTRMGKKFQQIGLVALGAAIGVAASLHFSAVADRQVGALQLPVDDLRLFSEVFGRIKSDYVEPVEDRKLLKEAITGLRP